MASPLASDRGPRLARVVSRSLRPAGFHRRVGSEGRRGRGVWHATHRARRVGACGAAASGHCARSHAQEKRKQIMTTLVRFASTRTPILRFGLGDGGAPRPQENYFVRVFFLSLLFFCVSSHLFLFFFLLFSYFFFARCFVLSIRFRLRAR